MLYILLDGTHIISKVAWYWQYHDKTIYEKQLFYINMSVYTFVASFIFSLMQVQRKSSFDFKGLDTAQ